MSRLVDVDPKSFHAHLDVCVQCAAHPFEPCSVGAELLTLAATGESAPKTETAVGIGWVSGRRCCALERIVRGVICVEPCDSGTVENVSLPLLLVRWDRWPKHLMQVSPALVSPFRARP